MLLRVTRFRLEEHLVIPPERRAADQVALEQGVAVEERMEPEQSRERVAEPGAVGRARVVLLLDRRHQVVLEEVQEVRRAADGSRRRHMQRHRGVGNPAHRFRTRRRSEIHRSLGEGRTESLTGKRIADAHDDELRDRAVEGEQARGTDDRGEFRVGIPGVQHRVRRVRLAVARGQGHPHLVGPVRLRRRRHPGRDVRFVRHRCRCGGATRYRCHETGRAEDECRAERTQSMQ